MSRSKSNSQTDPFNAGRPSFGDDGLESSGAGEQPPESWDYDGSSSSKRSKKKKKRSGERTGEDGGTSSPFSSGSSVPSSSSSSHSSRSSSYSSSPSAADERAARENAEQERKRQEQARREANQRKGSDYSTTSGSGYSTAQGSYDGASQQTTRRADAPQSKSKSSLGLACVFYVFVPLILCAPLLLACVSTMIDDFEDEQEAETVLELVEERFDSLEDDDELREQIASDFDAELIYYTDYDAEALGLDPYDFADWLLSEFSYDIEVDDFSFYSGSGSASFYTTGRDLSAEGDFCLDLMQFLYDEDLCYYASDELDEEQQAKVQAMYEEMLEEYDTSESEYFSFHLVQNDDDEWEIAENSFEEELIDTLAGSGAEEDIDYEERDDCTEGASLVNSRIASLTEDEELHTYIVNEFNDYLDLYAHYDAEGLGLDADAFADWYLANVSCHINDAYTYESVLYISADVTYVDTDELDGFCDSVEAYLDEQDVKYYSDQALTDAQKEHIQELYDSFIADYDLATQYDYGYLSLELTEVDGAWALDEDAWLEELEMEFYL